MKKKNLFLLIVLVVSLLIMSGCGVPQEGVNVIETDPSGFWQSLVVWPLAKALIFLDETLAGMGIPFHWGFAIIVFTLLIKVLTLPLTISQIRGMQSQKEMQPKIQELQKKYKGDREKIAAEQMKLYQEAGINPLSGCLPLLVQMPVLIGLYAALVTIGPMLKNSQWFWIPDLGFPTYNLGLGWLTENFTQGNYVLLISYLILPILLMISQVWMQKMMTPPSSDPQMKSMQQVSMMMTVMFGFFTLQVPAGLTLYWVTSNLLQMLQQWIFTRVGISQPITAMSTVNATASANGASSVASSSSINGSSTNGSSGSATSSKSGLQSGSSRPSGSSGKSKSSEKSKRK